MFFFRNSVHNKVDVLIPGGSLGWDGAVCGWRGHTDFSVGVNAGARQILHGESGGLQDAPHKLIALQQGQHARQSTLCVSQHQAQAGITCALSDALSNSSDMQPSTACSLLLRRSAALGCSFRRQIQASSNISNDVSPVNYLLRMCKDVPRDVSSCSSALGRSPPVHPGTTAGSAAHAFKNPLNTLARIAQPFNVAQLSARHMSIMLDSGRQSCVKVLRSQGYCHPDARQAILLNSCLAMQVPTPVLGLAQTVPTKGDGAS